MPSAILNSPNWIRSIEALYKSNEFTGTPLAASINALTEPAFPGQVMHIVNNEVTFAEQALDEGNFFGLLYTEISSIIDESEGGSLAPVLIRGPATVTVMNLNSAGQPLIHVPPALSLKASKAVELIAYKGGFLKIREGETGPCVGTLQNVLSDRIEVQLKEPSGSPSKV